MPRAEITGGAFSLRATLQATAAGLLVSAVPAAAQKALPRVSQEVVQQLPGRNSGDLNAALARLGRNPRDVEALIDAGKAALAMGDADAAVGFFGRADQVSPGNSRVKAGLASALVRNENPYDAIPLFQEAERSGALDASFSVDRALAYDLVGDNATAQRYYRDVLARGSNDEASRRLALSLAMSGDKQGAERALASLLARQDKASFRTRAFALAIAGQVEDAVGIAHASLPQQMAASISPYLRYMPRLTRAQQAAAANFGHFPRASEIGRDDPRVASYTASNLRIADAGTATRGASSAGRGKAPARTGRRTGAAPVRTLPPEPQVSREVSAPSLTVRAPAAPAPQPAAPARAQPTPPSQQLTLNQPATPSAPVPATPPQQVAAAAPVPAVTRPTPPPVAAAPPVARSAPPQPAAPRNVASAFGDFVRAMPDATPTAGAVDIRQITPARPKPKVEAPKPPPKPAPPAHPSRIWVQVATGRDKDALAFDWRRMSRQAAEVFRGKKASVSDWGARNRLLAGPFPTEAAANAFMTQLRTAKIDGSFVWTSPAGQVVDALPTP